MKSIKCILFALAVLMVCSCSKRDYQQVIPANATVVAKVNLKSLSEKGDFAHSALLDMVGAMSGGSKEMNKYTKDPMETGIDFTEPVYVFVTQDNLYGAVAKVANKSDLEDFFSVLRKQNVASRPTEKNGLTCGSVGFADYAFDGDALLLVGGVSGRSVSTEVLVRMMENEGESFIDTEAFKKMEDAGGKDIVMYANLGNLLGVLPKDIKTYMQNDQLKASDIDLLANVDFVDGSAIMATKWWGKTEKAQKMIDDWKEVLQAADGCYIEDVPENMVAWFGAGVKGNKALEKLKGNALAKESLFMMERAIDIEQMIRSIDGDVSIAVPKTMLSGRGDVDLAVKAKLKETAFLADVDDWKKSMADYGISMQSTGKDAYSLWADGLNIHWGVEGGNLYFATPKAYQQMNTKNSSSALKEYEKEIKDSRMFFFIDLQKILKANKPYVALASKAGVNLQSLKAVVLKSPAHDEMILRIDMDDSNKNFLKQLLIQK